MAAPYRSSVRCGRIPFFEGRCGSQSASGVRQWKSVGSGSVGMGQAVEPQEVSSSKRAAAPPRWGTTARPAPPAAAANSPPNRLGTAGTRPAWASRASSSRWASARRVKRPAGRRPSLDRRGPGPGGVNDAALRAASPACSARARPPGSRAPGGRDGAAGRAWRCGPTGGRWPPAWAASSAAQAAMGVGAGRRPSDRLRHAAGLLLFLGH